MLPSRVREGAVRAADAVVGAVAIVAVELAVALVRGRAEISGSWEVSLAIQRLLPIGWLVAAPAAFVGACALAGAERAGQGSRAARAWLALSAGAAGGAVGLGVSQGRHFAALPLRAAFVATLATLGALLVALAAPVAGRAATRAPRWTALGAIALVVAAELTNARVLPRLYPTFHLALAVAAAAASAWVALALRDDLPRALRVGAGSLLLAAAALSLPASARRLARADNLRLIVIERAPLLARAVEVAALVAPPEPLPDVDAPAVASQGAPALDWRGRDIVLISVDALRADHVGAYGYARATTPHLDALAASGVVFERAYCATPHTSYSVASMMTGKPMRPLLLQGLGDDSDTLAGLARRYGYRTAAFYPPAVFFIDPERFTALRDRGLDFEYRRVEFSDPGERARGVAAYLARRKPDRRVLLWVHLFEPHEPYVAHPEHPFGDRDIDRYDSEIAAADDGIGAIVAAVRAVRPRAIVVVTADHGEAFGEHGARYHGTSVYEEQVRVPLVISGEGIAPRRVQAPAQTIDILPTVLAALDIPRPARVRGHDLGPLVAGASDAAAGSAFAETDDQTLLADGALRLVCERRVGACALYDLATDPGEARDASARHPAEVERMRGALATLERSHGRFEQAGRRAEGKAWPEALRRGIAGDGDAAADVAALLDDADVTFRRKAGEVLFDLRRVEAAPALRLALGRDDDAEVRRWCAVTLTRLGQGAASTVELLEDAAPAWRRRAALALAEAGDARGRAELARWWSDDPPPYERARDVVAALGKVRAKEGVAGLVRSLEDVRLRPLVAAALASIGDGAARGPLAVRLTTERSVASRVALADALATLGGGRELAPTLARLLGTPDPLPGGLAIAARARILDAVGGPGDADLASLRSAHGAARVVRVLVPAGGAGRGARVLVRGRATGARPVELRIGAPLASAGRHDAPLGELDVRSAVRVELPPGSAAVERWVELPSSIGARPGAKVTLVVEATGGEVDLDAIAVVSLADELPPPPPAPWHPTAADVAGREPEDVDE